MSLQSTLDRIRTELEFIGHILEKTRPETKGQPENSLEVVRQRLIEHVRRESSVREAIDEACRERIENHPWPKMDWWTATFVWDRLYEADLFGTWLQAHGFYAADRTEAEILAFLLVDHWADLGIIRLKSRLDDFGTSSGQVPGSAPRL